MELQLQPMSDQDYTDWLADIIPEYAQEKVANGTWIEAESLQKSRESINSLLPQGMTTENHYLFSLRLSESDERVGFLWFGRYEQAAYLYDISIVKAHRRKGYGRQAMQLLEIAAAQHGFDQISLHVFGENRIARELYLSVGYVITDLTMRKKLPAPKQTAGS
jgi:ribosomal protein S18 acetylase RimI-like enzyme|uniref:GNAT family N-acetyltransferase n=1 Tax=Cephaloticoccus sp. TaxID=1985742 RepID=UPI00404B0407